MTRRSDRRKSGAKPAGRKGATWLWGLGILFAAVVILGFRLMTPQPGAVAENLRAAILDQLSPAFPNDEFRSSVTEDLEKFGLPVDAFEGQQIDVDLYRSLATSDYGVLVIRSHSGILELEGEEVRRVTALFTNEPYSQQKHVADQLRDRVLIVRPFEQDLDVTFGITPEFVLRSMKGRLPRSIVIIAGCSVLGRTDMADALVSRGASVVISWDRSVYLSHADSATALLVSHLLRDGMTVEAAVADSNRELGPDPEYGAVLRYYPDDAGRHTAAQLLSG